MRTFKMLNIVIPMAGIGSRFIDAGYNTPKPLIPVHNKSMIEVVIHNLTPSVEHKFIFLCLKEHITGYKINEKLDVWAPDCEIIPVEKVTEGAACTVLEAKKYINNSDPLMIANCDQWIDFDINYYLSTFSQSKYDGMIMTMKSSESKWSYVQLNKENFVINVVEKEVISDEATVGIYNFRKGSDYVDAAELMIDKNIRVNNEFYVAPVYNQSIIVGKKIGIYNIGRVMNGMYGLGTPADLKNFLELAISQKAVNF